MRNFAVLSVLFLALYFGGASTASADTVTLIKFGAQIGSIGHGGPFQGTLNGSSITMVCVSFDRRVYEGETWNVTVNGLTAAGVANGLYGGQANALAVFPGGFGTMDEMFELLTLEQTKKSPIMPLVLVGKAYWSKVINWKAIADYGMIEKADLGLFDMVDTAEEAWESMQRRGLTAHSQQGAGA